MRRIMPENIMPETWHKAPDRPQTGLTLSMLQTFKGVIFDMDGLMLDTEPIYWMSMQQAAEELGYNIEEQLHDRLVGRSLSGWRDTLVQRFGEDYPQFRNRRRQLWEQHIQNLGVAPKAGLGELLTQ